MLLIVNVALKQKRLPLLEVNYIGKAATFNLLYAFPLLFLSQSSGWVGSLGYILGWAFSAWGVALYLITGFGYLVSGVKSIRFPNGLIISN
jgi:cardiolipin synthase